MVFTPPPVDPGDAPTNISAITTVSPAGVKLESGAVEKPAVRVEKLKSTAFSHENPSVNLRRTAPSTWIPCAQNSAR